MFEKIHNVITEGAYSHKPLDGQLEPIHCLDICNIIGQNVVVGGVRRTAEIAIIDPSDTECVRAKVDLTPEKYHRFMSNNSVYLTSKPTKEQLDGIFDSIRKSGEPAFINAEEGKRRRNDFAGVNPCVSGDTKILTKQYGYIPIIDVCGEHVDVWNGYEWSEVIPNITGYNQEMVRVKFSNGLSIDCTKYHKFILLDDTRVEAKNLSIGDKLMKHDYPVIDKSADVIGMSIGKEKRGYIYGFYSGDGVKNTDKIWLYGDKKPLSSIFENSGCRINYHDSRDTVSIKEKVRKNQVPNIGDNISFRLDWLAGLIDSDGCRNSAEGSVAISSIDKDFLTNVLFLLQSLGVSGSVAIMREEGSKLMPKNDGTGEKAEYFSQRSYRLVISASNVKKLIDLGLVTYRVDLSNVNPNRNASRFITVTEVLPIEDSPVVYCFNESLNHSGMFNGIMTAQCAEILLPPNAVCNLTTVNLVAFVNNDKTVDFDGLKKAFGLSARACYRMTCVDLELAEWNETHHKDRLLGCSMTGYQDFLGKALVGGKIAGYIDGEMCYLSEQKFLNLLKEAVNAEARYYSSTLGTPKSLLTTAVKPEGSLSLVANGVSAGLHFQHSKYFIRRVRVNAVDPLAKTAVALGWQIHPEVGQTMENATTLVIDFPCESPSKRTKFDVSAVEQLDIYRMFQKHYTEQNTSNTITVKPDEWNDVVDYVYEYWDDILAVSFLGLDENTYPLMPYESCTKEQYEELKVNMKPFDSRILNNFEITTRNMGKEFEILDDRTECASGVCPIR